MNGRQSGIKAAFTAAVLARKLHRAVVAKRRAPATPERQLDLDSAAAEPEPPPPASPDGRPPVILQLGPRDFSVLV